MPIKPVCVLWMFWCCLISKSYKATVLEYFRGSLHCNMFYRWIKSPLSPDTRRHTCRRWAGRGEVMIRGGKGNWDTQTWCQHAQRSILEVHEQKFAQNMIFPWRPWDWSECTVVVCTNLANLNISCSHMKYVCRGFIGLFDDKSHDLLFKLERALKSRSSFSCFCKTS